MHIFLVRNARPNLDRTAQEDSFLEKSGKGHTAWYAAICWAHSRSSALPSMSLSNHRGYKRNFATAIDSLSATRLYEVSMVNDDGRIPTFAHRHHQQPITRNFARYYLTTLQPPAIAAHGKLDHLTSARGSTQRCSKLHARVLESYERCQSSMMSALLFVASCGAPGGPRSVSDTQIVPKFLLLFLDAYTGAQAMI